MQRTVAFVFGNGVEELELIAPADLLRRAGASVLLVSTEPTVMVNTRGGFQLQADRLFDELDLAVIDLLVLPGGPGVVALRSHAKLRGLLQTCVEAGKPLAAICAAPLLLHDAGLLADRRFTCHFSCREELPRADRTSRVVADGQIITSQGAGTSIDFGLALVEKLYGSDVRTEISSAIMA
ncbi:MAG: hypothetical protein RI957_1221 [Verrucomicrobiota bacterium]